MAERQLVLDLGGRPSWRADDFLVSEANRAAAGWLDRWPDWPAPALVVYGPAGCGKTHLVQGFAARTGALALPRPALAGADPETLAAAHAVIVVEDADGVGGSAADDPGERALLHLYNSLAAAGGRLLLTARRRVPDWPLRLADLRSRLLAAIAVSIGPPDDELIAAVLVKLFADRQLRVDDDVVHYLVARVERSFAAAQAIVARLDRAALVHRRPVTVPLVRRLLASGEDARPDD
jgi:DnaA regulatory inactivator Hda